jgi:hypothetical protein
MRFPKNMALFVSVIAAGWSFAADPVPAGSPDPLANIQLAPAKAPATDGDKTLPVSDSNPRPEATPSLLPDAIPPGTKRPATTNSPAGGKPGPAMKPKATAEELDLRIRYRKARTVAEMNDKVRAAWENSRGTKTDHEKRQALKRYYEVLFAKMIAVDRGVTPLVQKQLKAETDTLTQTHIAPTIPIFPDE